MTKKEVKAFIKRLEAERDKLRKSKEVLENLKNEAEDHLEGVHETLDSLQNAINSLSGLV